MKSNTPNLPESHSSLQDKTEKDEGFFSVLLDITKKHPILFTSFFLIPFVILLISLWYKWFYLFNDTTHYLTDFQVLGGKWSDSKSYFGPAMDKYIRELDIAGLVGELSVFLLGCT
ncbi:MAG: hypothetical protein R2822_03655 [Spirosomataceae bacterium]